MKKILTIALEVHKNGDYCRRRVAFPDSCCQKFVQSRLKRRFSWAGRQKIVSVHTKAMVNGGSKKEVNSHDCQMRVTKLKTDMNLLKMDISSRCEEVRGQPQRDRGRTSDTVCTSEKMERGTRACKASKLGPVERWWTQDGKLGITIQDPPPESRRRTHL